MIYKIARWYLLNKIKYPKKNIQEKNKNKSKNKHPCKTNKFYASFRIENVYIHLIFVSDIPFTFLYFNFTLEIKK